MIDINIQEPYFNFIMSGKKTIEGRLNKGKFINLQIGDVLRINNQVNFVIQKINYYNDFKTMITTEGLNNVIPDAKNLSEALDVYYKFYSPDDEINFGVLAIKIVRQK